MNKRLIYILLLFFCCSFLGFGQRFHISKEKKFEKIKFELVNNLMVIPVELNNAKLSFILDTGVSSPILFNLMEQDSVQINNVSEIMLRGLGDGDPIQALRSSGNVVQIGNAKSFNMSLHVVLDKDINFSTSLGIPVHGIIGYDLFKDFVVEVNYGKGYLKLFRPKDYVYKESKKTQTLPLNVINRKAYLDVAITKQDDTEVPVKLLVDTGSSDALWLFQNLEKGLEVPDTHYNDFLGKGLSGNIFGKRTKLKGIRIGRFKLNDAKAAFPFRESFEALQNLRDRNGSLGGEVLKRFNIVFDYARGQISLKKNNNFKNPFQYNLAGIELQHNGLRYLATRLADANGIVRNDARNFGNVQLLLENRTRLSLVPEIVVSGIRADSPAAHAGLKEGDVILAVNGKQVHNFKLQEILHMLNQREGKKVRVQIQRYNRDFLFTFVLKDVFEPKKP